MASPYGKVARSYGYNYGLLGLSVYSQSRHSRVQAQQYKAVRTGNRRAGTKQKPAQIRASLAPRKGAVTKKGTNISGYKRLNRTQRAGLNSQQRAMYTARRNTVNTRRASVAIFAGYVAPYAIGLSVKKLNRTNVQGTRVGKTTYIVGGIKRTGSYWTRQGKRANFAVRIPRIVAQGTPGRKPPGGRLMIPSRTGGFRTSAYHGAKNFGRRAGRTYSYNKAGRVRRNYKGQFSGWF